MPVEAAVQPPGWRVRLVKPHRGSGHWIEWYMPAARANAGVAPQTSLDGFALVLADSDEAHLSGNFTVQTDNRGAASAALALLDTTPPTLTLEIRAASVQPRVSASVQVVATVKDDHDPEPTLVLESVGRADTADGSGYKVTYSAIDASGNRTTTSARVPLPAGGLAPAAPGLLPMLQPPRFVSRPQPDGTRPEIAARQASVCLAGC